MGAGGVPPRIVAVWATASLSFLFVVVNDWGDNYKNFLLALW